VTRVQGGRGRSNADEGFEPGKEVSGEPPSEFRYETEGDQAYVVLSSRSKSSVNVSSCVGLLAVLTTDPDFGVCQKMVNQGDRIQRSDEKRLRIGRGRIHAGVEGRIDVGWHGRTEVGHIRGRCHFSKRWNGKEARIERE
jgi:hypothetical protein